MNEKILLFQIPVIKGVYKTLFFTEYKVIMLFLPRGSVVNGRTRCTWFEYTPERS